MVKIPSIVTRVSQAAAVICGIQAVTTLVLATILIITFDECLESSADAGAKLNLYHIMSAHYLKASSCSNPEELQDGILQAATFYVWLIIILSFSALWAVVSLALMISVAKAEGDSYSTVGYMWAAVTLAAAVIDVTLGVMFAYDYHTLNDNLFSASDPEAYKADLLRIAAFCMMTLSFKGYALLIVNITLVVLVIICAKQMRRPMVIEEHSVHTQGILRAFPSTMYKDTDQWRQQPNYDILFGRISQNLTSNNNRQNWQDETLQRAELKSFDRSDSWHHTKSGPATMGLGRSVSYVESRVESPSPPTAAGAPGPLNLWDGPPLPAPDYSPVHQKRLKSALKSTF